MPETRVRKNPADFWVLGGFLRIKIKKISMIMMRRATTALAQGSQEQDADMKFYSHPSTKPRALALC